MRRKRPIRLQIDAMRHVCPQWPQYLCREESTRAVAWVHHDPQAL